MSVAKMKITAAQLNPVVGDVVNNVFKIREAFLEAEARGGGLVVFPELSVTGCPLGDLVNRPDFVDAAELAARALAAATAGRKAAMIVGAPVRRAGGVFNAALVVHGGRVVREIAGKGPSGRDAFDERRGFAAEGDASLPVAVRGMPVGVMVGGDAWSPEISRELCANGAKFLVSINASPFRPGILRTRVEEVAAARVEENGVPFLYVNAVGGQDETVFDGGSFLLDGTGKRVMSLPQWEECVMDFDAGNSGASIPDEDYPDALDDMWRAMMLGVRDYVGKSGFTDVLLGLSGGIDSAVAAAAAGDAIGPDKVHCVRLPSEYTAGISNSAAEKMCRTWGFSMETHPIGKVTAAAAQTLAEGGVAALKGLTRENMQARARGYILMTLSNERGWLLLSTGNKSEIAVGYATLYGDMCGGFNPLKDVYKTTVFQLARWRNRHRPAGLLGPSGVVIPPEIIARAPSAELSPGQKDSDSLPPYDVLDAILADMTERRMSVAAIVEQGFPADVVERVHQMVARAEYKRRQGAPGPKAGCPASARDRRLPIVNKFVPGMLDALRSLDPKNLC